MLVVVSTNQSAALPPAVELTPEKVVNVSSIYGPSLVPSNFLAPPKVINESVIQQPVLMPIIVHTLTPAQVVNASVFFVQQLSGNVATAYANAGGTGNRTALITVTLRRTTSAASILGGGSPDNLVDGAIGFSFSDAIQFNGVSDYEIYFDFRPTGFKQIIDEITMHQTVADGHGTWVVEAWDGNGAWTVLKTAFPLGNASPQLIPFFNATGFHVYRLRQISGPASSGSRIQEFEFKIAQGASITAATSYANAGGTGDRRATITASTTLTLTQGTMPLLVDGIINSSQVNWGAETGKQIKFALAVAKVIDEFRWLAGNGGTQGAWLAFGSNDDATYHQLGTPFELKGAPSFVPVVYGNIKGNVKPYSFYKFEQVKGMVRPDGGLIGDTTAGATHQAEIEFKIAA